MKRIYLIISIIFMTYALSAQCYPNRHNTSANAAWISCQKTANPNPIRGLSHWIMYDLGENKSLGHSRFWNVNVPGSTAAGIRLASIDLSTDGVLWEEWGDLQLEEADASGFYEGEEGPDFKGVEARYILITAKENHGHNCTGLGELKINIDETSSLVENLSDSGVATLFPNPANEITYVKLELDERVRGKLQIIDLNGRSVRQQILNLPEGTHSIPIITKDLPAGPYILRIVSETFSQSLKLTVSHEN